jgi:poly(A) polymerase
MQPTEPTIISRADHGISRTSLNQNALRVLYRLRDHGFVAHLVGGCVRDLLLGREPKDYDIATSATPGQVKRLFRNCRLVGRRFRLAHLHFAEGIIEVATFRSGASEADLDEPETGGPDEGDEPRRERWPEEVVRSDEGVLLRDNRFGSPAEDARRRDFTVNALAYRVDDFAILDYVGGMADLRTGTIRTIGDPWERFTEDPVRMLRGVRFAASLGFTMEPQTWLALTEMSQKIVLASPPRLFDELVKLLLQGEGVTAYQLLRRTGLFSALFPQMATWLTEESEGFPHVLAGDGLVWVDRRLAEGRKVSPPLLLALFFGEYLTEKGQRFREHGAGPQESLDQAVAEFVSETAPTVSITNRVAMQLREILILQLRFARIPGRKPESVAARPGFPDALEYLRYRASRDGQIAKSCHWWERLEQGGDGAGESVPAPEDAGSGSTRRRRRRRKRRSRPAGGETDA